MYDGYKLLYFYHSQVTQQCNNVIARGNRRISIILSLVRTKGDVGHFAVICAVCVHLAMYMLDWAMYIQAFVCLCCSTCRELQPVSIHCR